MKACIIEELIKTKGIETHELAELAGLDPDFAVKIVSGERLPLLYQLKSIADVLGLKIWDLFHPKIPKSGIYKAYFEDGFGNKFELPIMNMDRINTFVKEQGQ